MLRSLWSAASGMYAQQLSLDNISNNISNINTTGFKTQTTEFKSLLYQELKHTSNDYEGNPKPVGIQVGSGVRDASITTIFTQGAAQSTEQPLDLLIQGKGFFAIDKMGTTGYTRNGHFALSRIANGWQIADSEGHAVLNTEGQNIVLSDDMDASKLSIDTFGNVNYNTEDENGILHTQKLGRIALYQFNDPAGLTKSGDSLYFESPASGTPRLEATDNSLSKSTLKQGYLEASNVQAADEMVNMIVTQRAYQLNSKAITTSDTMLEIANGLKR
jgi:flagellar basal-body rod protein FlgG